jgi:hypothetical protein
MKTTSSIVANKTSHKEHRHALLWMTNQEGVVGEPKKISNFNSDTQVLTTPKSSTFAKFVVTIDLV